MKGIETSERSFGPSRTGVVCAAQDDAAPDSERMAGSRTGRAQPSPAQNGVMEWYFSFAPSRITLLLHSAVTPWLQCPAEILEAIEAFLNYVDAGGVTEPHRAIVPESSARHDSNVRLT